MSEPTDTQRAAVQMAYEAGVEDGRNAAKEDIERLSAALTRIDNTSPWCDHCDVMQDFARAALTPSTSDSSPK